jgi:hypothetical protein
MHPGGHGQHLAYNDAWIDSRHLEGASICMFAEIVTSSFGQAPGLFVIVV